MKVTLVSVTPDAETLLVYTARVSSPQNQGNMDTGPRLLRYCMKAGHWSVFEQAHMTVEVETSRAISAQILRHRSMNAQEFSLRYAEAIGFETYEARRQDVKNRQNSLDDMSEEDRAWFLDAQATNNAAAAELYREALSRGIAKELARFLLPLSTTTRLYLTNSVRGWTHYLKVRTDPSTQKEHRDIALAVYDIFRVQFPTVAEAMGPELSGTAG